jgi:hypothetical protein
MTFARFMPRRLQLIGLKSIAVPSPKIKSGDATSSVPLRRVRRHGGW